jgi:hypothetical protein
MHEETHAVEATAKLNRLEQEIAAAEGSADDARWAQAEEVVRLLDGGMTQRAVAAGWINARTGNPYTHKHVGFCKDAWKQSGYPGTQARPAWNTAYQKAKRGDRPKAGPRKKDRTKKATEPTFTDGKPSLSRVPAVQEWVRDRSRAGWDREKIVAASKARSDGWPAAAVMDAGLEEKVLSNGSYGEVCTAIVAVERALGTEAPMQPKKQKKESGKPLRELYTKRKSGDADLYHDVMIPIMEAVRALESYDLPDLNWSETTQGTVVRIFDYLNILDKWTETSLATTMAHMDDLGIQRKIVDCERIMADPGAPPNEKANAARAVERLNARRARDRLAG